MLYRRHDPAERYLICVLILKFIVNILSMGWTAQFVVGIYTIPHGRNPELVKVVGHQVGW